MSKIPTIEEDVALATGRHGSVSIRKRTDTLASSAGTDGDAAYGLQDANGRDYVYEKPVAADGATPYSEVSLTATGTTTIEAPATLWNFHAANGDSGAVQVKAYNKATAATQADTPVIRMTLAAGTDRNLVFPKGLKLTAGLSIRATTELTDAGTTGATANKVSANLTATT